MRGGTHVRRNARRKPSRKIRSGIEEKSRSLASRAAALSRRRKNLACPRTSQRVRASRDVRPVSCTVPPSAGCRLDTRQSTPKQESRIEIIFELVLTTIGEIVIQLVAEILIELGYGSIGASLRSRSKAHPAMAAVGVVLLGGLAGVLSSLIWPTLILRPGPVPGMSLLISPLINGLVMDRYGEWRERHGRERSFVATFWGGALFAFSMALVRFLWVGKSALDV